MTRRTRLVLVSLAGIVALQAALWLVYRAVTEARRAPANIASEALSGRAPMKAELQARDGRTPTLAELGGGRPVLLHFWATWCAPCQDELPTLLELEQAPPAGLALALVSVDQEWRAVEAFFAGAVPRSVLRDGAVAPALGVSTLPDSYLIGPDGALLARFHGARDWSSPEMKNELRRRLGGSPP